MKFSSTSISDVLLIEPKVFSDPRGYFIETYREDVFKKQGITTRFVQDNLSHSVKGVLRGMHYQLAPKAQAKLVRVLRGEIYDVAVDLRPKSKTCGRYVAQILSEKNKRMMYIPEGFAHGFLTLSNEADVHYKVSQLYSPTHERGLRWDDPDVQVRWPKLGKAYSFSPKDKSYPSLNEIHRHR